MRLKRLIFISIFAVAAGAAHASVNAEPDVPAYFYRQGKIEPAISCSATNTQSKRPRFHGTLRDAVLKNIVDHMLRIDPGASVPELVGTFWQLDYVQQMNGDEIYGYFICSGKKYFSFRIFKPGNFSALMLIGVAENDAGIFNTAHAMTDQQAAAELDPEHFFATTADRRGDRLDPARAAPSEWQENYSSGSEIIAESDAREANEAVNLSSGNLPVNFHTVKEKAPARPVRKSIAPTQAVQDTVKTTDLPASSPSISSSSPSLSAYHKAAPWSKVRNSQAWTKAAVATIQKRWTSLNRARDVDSFCPGYSKASSTRQMACWIRIVGGIMQKESGFQPNDSMIENSGEASVGLMAMSAGQCPNARSSRALKNPIANIECGINVMANLIQQDGYISGPRNKGAARNWSCLRTPYTTYVRSHHKKVRVGFKHEIMRVASTYDRVI